MKNRPILFSSPMVLALLNGSKTQTRRAVKPQFEREPVDVVNGVPSWDYPTNYDGDVQMNTMSGKPCPHGVPGDHLWVREAIRLVPDQEPDDGTGPVLSVYAADGVFTVADAWPWKRTYLPSMHCPRGLSRITLEITDVRVERLQDISEADAVAEGIRISSAARRSDACYGIYECLMPDGKTHFNDSAYSLYRTLWEQINGSSSWDANPWVWVVEFKRVT